MTAIYSENMLRLAILQLEEQQKQETEKLRAAFKQVYESVKPINLIRNSMKEVTHSPDGSGSTLQATVGMGVGYIVKTLVVGASPTPMKRLLGNAIGFGISNLITRNPGILNGLSRILTKWKA